MSDPSNGLVSILIPVYNRENLIAETIQSAISQSYKNIEVIIVDNASTDNTWSVVSSFLEQDSRIKAYKNESNIGPVRNWLRCVEEASGVFGKILWSDDLISPDFIEKTITLFNKDVGFVYTGAYIFNGSSYYDRSSHYLLPRTGLYSSTEFIEKALFGAGIPFSPGCAIFRLKDIQKNLLIQIPNKINSDFSSHAIGNDLLLFLLSANQYEYFGHIAEPLSFFRAHNESISVSSDYIKLNLFYFLAKAHFVENFRLEYLNLFAANLQSFLWRQKKNTIKYNLNNVSDFFYCEIKVKFFYLIRVILYEILLSIKHRLAVCFRK